MDRPGPGNRDSKGPSAGRPSARASTGSGSAPARMMSRIHVKILENGKGEAGQGREHGERPVAKPRFRIKASFSVPWAAWQLRASPGVPTTCSLMLNRRRAGWGSKAAQTAGKQNDHPGDPFSPRECPSTMTPSLQVPACPAGPFAISCHCLYHNSGTCTPEGVHRAPAPRVRCAGDSIGVARGQTAPARAQISPS